MKIYICDDNPEHSKHCADYIMTFPSQRKFIYDLVCECILPERLVEFIATGHLDADMIIMDIEMPDIDGVDGIALAKQINRIAPECPIIYLTGYLDYAPLVYESNHIYFILKNQMEERLPMAFEKFFSHINLSDESILFSTNGRDIDLKLNHIWFIEKEKGKHYVKIFTKDSTNEPLLHVTYSIKNLSSKLGPRFVQCHNSFIINMDHIEHLNKDSFTLKNQKGIPVGRCYKKKAIHAYMSHIANQL